MEALQIMPIMAPVSYTHLATPIALSDPRFKAQGFRTVTIDADYDYRQEITVIHSNRCV